MTARHRYLLAALLGAGLAGCTLYTSHFKEPVENSCGNGGTCPDASVFVPDACDWCAPDACVGSDCYGGGSDGGCGGGSDGGGFDAGGFDGGGFDGGIFPPDAANCGSGACI